MSTQLKYCVTKKGPQNKKKCFWEKVVVAECHYWEPKGLPEPSTGRWKRRFLAKQFKWTRSECCTSSSNPLNIFQQSWQFFRHKNIKLLVHQFFQSTEYFSTIVTSTIQREIVATFHFVICNQTVLLLIIHIERWKTKVKVNFTITYPKIYIQEKVKLTVRKLYHP